MRGLGTLCNVLAVLAGGGLGLLLKSGLSERFQKILMQACALAVLFIGASGAMAGLLAVNGGSLGTQGSTLMVLSLVFGGLMGEALNIELRMEKLGSAIRARFGAGEDAGFVNGFVTASLVICVGAMAVVGSIQDGLTGDWSMLLAKSMLDFIIVMVFASTMGAGVLLSALPLGIYQGGITLLAGFIAPWLTDALISNLSFIGSVLIFAVGVNLLRPGTFRVGNLLPALLVPAAWELII
ncbi:MAG: DUF554 domain-containing protein [Candidatus Heteroscillospira sp.]|jgi:uncharacterized membrane protein YqgA involved in biofilm formation